MDAAEREQKLKITHIPFDGGTVIELAGSANMTEAALLKKQLARALADSTGVVILDMKDLDFICSMSLGVLVALQHKFRPQRGSFRLARVTAKVLDVFHTTRLDTLFEVFESLDGAKSA